MAQHRAMQQTLNAVLLKLRDYGGGLFAFFAFSLLFFWFIRQTEGVYRCGGRSGVRKEKNTQKVIGKRRCSPLQKSNE